MQVSNNNTLQPFMGVAFVMCLFGYNALAPILERVSLENSTGSIIIRGLTLLLVILAIAGKGSELPKMKLTSLFFLYSFLGLYLMRLIDNYFVQQLPMYAPPEVSIGILIGSCLIPTIIMSQLVPFVKDKALTRAFVFLALIFIFGMSLNIERVLSMFGGRGLETMFLKLNPISLSSVSASFFIFFIMMGKLSKKYNFYRVLLMLILILIVAITRSRGPLIAMVISLLIYFSFSSVRSKKKLFRGLLGIGVIAFLASAYFDINFAGLAFERFSIGDGSVSNLDQSAQGRIFAWSAAWEQLWESPFFGDKVYEPYLYKYPHNLFLESLISIGFCGTFFLIVFLIYSTNASIQILKLPEASLMERFVPIIYFKSLIEAQFSGAIWFHAPLWITAACVISLLEIRKRYPEGLSQ